MLQAAIKMLGKRDRRGRAEGLTAIDSRIDAHDTGALPSATFADGADDLERNVYCVLGLPIDVLDVPAILRRIEAATVSRASFLISTPNLNFLMNSRSDPEFRKSVLDSDLCPVDGMSIVWIARLIGLPIRQRVSGSDIFEALQVPDRCGRPLKVFLFGGAPGVAAAAAGTLNRVPSGLVCVGTLDPGFGSADEMSQDHMIDRVNASDADFLAVSLGAMKGQLWLHRNHQRITIPVRAHLGAAINFQAGTVKRAPPSLRAWGLEWLWRIKEEPHLWRRYGHDGLVLLRLLFSRILPLAIANRWYQFKSRRRPQGLLIKIAQNQDSTIISLCGDAIDRNIDNAISCFQETITRRNKGIVIDLSSTRVIDGRFFGLLLMLRKRLKGQGAKLTFVGVSPAIQRLFRLNELDFLLSGE
jgi:N-acetylglucosaminyldiphosphoundecaprenol N-acetyl-beta-D-mannosaminyltransferase